MHEAMIAENIFKQISEEALKQNSKPVSVKISCGQLNVINEEVLGFAFKAIAKDTIYEDTKLIVEQKPLQAVCKECNNNYDIDLSNLKCPNCQSENMEILPDSPLILEEIQFEKE